MNTRKNPIIAWTVLLVTALACNIPGGQPPVPGNQNPPVPQATVPNQQIPLSPPTSEVTLTPIATFTVTLTPTITLTPTPTVPMVSVSVDTNCRTGPGKVYDLVGGLLVGESAVVVGKFTAGNYWIINNPDASGTCWLWGQYATVSGNTSGLPEYTAPPTPTPSIPKPPKNLTAAKICIPIAPPPLFQYAGTIAWEDNSDNEDGFNIYYNGGLLGTTVPDATTYPIPAAPFPAGTPIIMGVESFNVTGKSVMKTVTIVCP